jgi:ABC-type glycerol-3-phosphate transport system permease component
MALPLASTIVCIFVFKAAFEAIPKSLIDAARVDGVPDWMIVFRIIMPLTRPAIATNVILSFIWSWNSFLWPLVIVRDASMQTLPLGLARFMSVVEDTTGALYAFSVMVLVPGLAIFLLAQKEFITGLTSGATKG